jgi:hypothetical protein
MVTKLLEEGLRDVRWSAGHGGGVVEHALLQVREGAALGVARDVEQLRLADADLSAPGRVDVDSAGAPDHDGHLELCELAKSGLDPTRPVQKELLGGPSFQDSGCVGHDGPGLREPARSTLDRSEEQAADPTH